MKYRAFGRTGLQTSIVGLGGGGASRLGLATGSTDDEVVALIGRAIDLGVNFIDTADNYGTEEVIGRALIGHRDEVIVSTKIYPRLEDASLLSRDALAPALEASLKRLRTDVVDVYHLHGVTKRDYAYCMSELVPELEALRDAGKVRFFGITERNSSDATHEMLKLAVHDDVWDVIMIGFNLFNQSARDGIFPETIRKDIAVEVMASARNQFSRPDLFGNELVRMVDEGVVSIDDFDRDNPLRFLDSLGADPSVSSASYRFAANEPGVHVVLVGTGSVKHLEENVAALNAGSLPDNVARYLIAAFGHLSRIVIVPDRVLRPE